MTRANCLALVSNYIVCSIIACLFPLIGIPAHAAGTLTGTIVDSANGITPVHPVWIWLWDAETGAPVEGSGVENGPDGSYTIENIAEGSYKVFYDTFGPAAGYADMLYDNVICASGCSFHEDGDILEITTGVYVANVRTANGLLLSGRVTNDSGVGIADVAIELFNSTGDHIDTSVGTSAEGNWFLGVPGSGTYYLRTAIGTSPGYQPEIWEDKPCDACDPVATGKPITVDDVAINGIDFQLQSIETIGRHYSSPIELDSRLMVMSQPEVFDINGDGKPDVAFSSTTDDVDAEAPLEIWISNDTGSLELSTDLLVIGGIPSTLRGFRQIMPADFNGDGRIDLFLESHGPEWDCGDGTGQCWPGGPNSLLLSDDGGQVNNVTATHLPNFSDFSHGSALLDFDGDGDLDIWVNNAGGNALQTPGFAYLLENDGEGSFSVVADASLPGQTPLVGRNGVLPESEWVSGAPAWSMAIDANGDGHTDLDFGQVRLWLDGGGRDFRNILMLNDGNGSFDFVPGDAWPPPSWTDTPTTHHALMYDLNNDGLKDQLLLHSPEDFNGYGLQVLISNGDGTFRDETDTRYPYHPHGRVGDAQLHDLDGDGHMDLFNMIDYWDVDIRVNDGEGNFRRLPLDWVETEWNWVVLDVDNDGGTDFLVSFPGGLWLYKMVLPYGPELDGTASKDHLIGGAHDNFYRGLGGDDVLDGGLGDDNLDGGPGDDDLFGGKGNDTYLFHTSDLSYTDTIIEKAGSDLLVFEDFGFDKVDNVQQDVDGNLVISFIDGGSLTIHHHFRNSQQALERLQVADCTYRISRDSEFESGSLHDILGGCILFESGFE